MVRTDRRWSDVRVRRIGRRLTLAAVMVVVVAAEGCLLSGAAVQAQSRDPYAEARNRMVDEEISREGVKHPGVLRSMRTVPRHRFVKQKDRAGAYFDQAIAIGKKQTISPPFIVAYMTEMLDPMPEDKVLEIGTGSGYQAAVLSDLVKDVYTIEIVEELGKSAAKVLKELKYDNVHPRIGDGFKGWPEAAPFDKIIVTCSPESVPQPLIEQLKEGGRMIIPLGERYEQRFYLFEKKNGELVKSNLLSALFVPMTGDAEKNRKVKPDPKHPEIHNGGFEIDDEGDGHPVGWHYQRQLTLEATNAHEGKAYVKFSNQDAGRSAQMLQGMVMDGTAVHAIQISMWVRADDIRNGPSNEQAAFVIQFYDSERRPIIDAEAIIGPFKGTFDWKKFQKTILVPAKSREAIVRVGLNGATGDLGIDDIGLSAQTK